MEVKRLKRCNGSFELVCDGYLFYDSGYTSETATDKSAYRPNVDEVHLGLGGQATTQPIYDFNDGIDTGFRLGALRDLGADITEIDAERSKLEKTANDTIKDAIERVKADDKTKSILDEIASHSVNSSNSTTQGGTD